ncbi:hypothetical protein P152DRAFT_437703 [Eremomyces bilateralis CBS 781.70]|uniref:Zn(2)-C6 fungal-type domain-containing protein n=1 Tax=Eremomyces bilateralis CBS 781.70 TaxID=1392243 RepID=A0A6G1G1B5_9PEZI|nr:uncharacterized protein P152DRAFT_437703 [Eremomyces bilateralis CBS 781.70]KAF1811844.1 hypothetical protein P152DRAFT_437703 [Eremomyces bilateralis CBS 781.70]
MVDNLTPNGERKGTRITKACDSCHRRGRRCRAQDDRTPCRTCIDAGIVCTRNRIPSKRGPKPRQHAQFGPIWALDPSKHGSRALLTTLIRSFFDFVYPIVNYVHEDSFMDQWTNGQLPNSPSSYALLMAMCALSAFRIKYGIEPSALDVSQNVDPDFYLDEALRTTQSTSPVPRDKESLQALGLLCMTALEIGNGSLLQCQLGYYHAAIADQNLYDERRWPPALSAIEKEEYRRLYWHLYRLEVHMALVMGHAIRCPEIQSMVSYPSLADQQDARSTTESEWLSGWNFVTDLYRGLEHVLTKFRLHGMPGYQSQRKGFLSTSFLLDFDLNERILQPLTEAFENLPTRFKTAPPLTSNVNANRCGFQAANIVCTYQLVRMVCYTSNKATFHQACRTALDLIEQISSIPLEYLRAMSLAAVQEISGFGHILSHFIGKELPMSDYQDLRDVILCMAEFLESLHTDLPYAIRASARLRECVNRISGLIDQSTAHTFPTSGPPVNFFGDSQAPEHSEMILDWRDDTPWLDEWLDSVASINHN